MRLRGSKSLHKVQPPFLGFSMHFQVDRRSRSFSMHFWVDRTSRSFSRTEQAEQQNKSDISRRFKWLRFCPLFYLKPRVVYSAFNLILARCLKYTCLNFTNDNLFFHFSKFQLHYLFDLQEHANSYQKLYIEEQTDLG